MGRSSKRALRLGLFAVVLLVGATSASGQQSGPAVDVVQVSGVVDPPVARHIRDRLESAAQDGTHALILQLDTPGGLQVSSRELVDAITTSKVPVIAWVAPRDAHAVFVGALMVDAAHIAYMAESTELGPISDGGESVGAEEAIAARDVDGKASSLRELLQAVDGSRVEREFGAATLETWDESRGAPSVTIRFAQMDPFQRLLHAVTDPKVALFLFLVGLFGLIFELYNPGIGLAALVGAGSLGLSLYALSILPTNWGALLVVTAAIGLLLLDLHATSLGPASVVGVAALITGAALLYSGAPDPFGLSPWAIAFAVVLTLLFFISVMTAALRVRLRRPVGEDEGVVGTIGEATTDIAPEGTVLTAGTLWRARTMETGIAAGAKVEVKATEGLVLLVEPLHEIDPSTEPAKDRPSE